MSSQLTLVAFTPESNKAELGRFVDLPWKIYSRYKVDAWVPPLKLQVRDNLDTKKNPFYLHAQIQLWNAYRGSQHVGRIAAVVDQVHLAIHEDECGFWGFYEVDNDPQASEALLAAAEAWVKSKGMKAIRGPMNPSLNHEAGLLIKGFETAPYVMMTHNPEYYANLVEKSGYKKAKDLLAFEMSTSQPFPERISRIAEKVTKKAELTFRPINMKKFSEEVKLIKEIYNDAWEKNWGFTPMNDAEFDHMAKGLKDVIWPEFCLIAYIRGEAVGFSLSLPDINQVLKTIPDGKLLPLGIFKLLWGLRPKSKKIDRVRVITLGIKQKYRASGIGGVFYVEAHKRANALGLRCGEMSWILEDNTQMLSAIRAFFGDHPPYKVYRIYEKALH